MIIQYNTTISYKPQDSFEVKKFEVKKFSNFSNLDLKDFERKIWDLG